MVFDRLQHLKLEIENDRQTKIVNLYNSAVVDYNDAINGLNEFINYRNKQFTPQKTDTQIQSIIDVVATKIKAAQNKISEVSSTDINTANMIRQLTKSIDDVSKQMNEQQDWLKIYFSKSKSGRKSMFYKVTWFGIPLN